MGHTFNYPRRVGEHKSKCNNSNSKAYNYKLYQVIRSKGGFDNWNIEVVEKYIECSSLEDARNKEKYGFNKLKANLSSNNPLRTNEEKQEYHQEYNKEFVLFFE